MGDASLRLFSLSGSAVGAAPPMPRFDEFTAVDQPPPDATRAAAVTVGTAGVGWSGAPAAGTVGGTAAAACCSDGTLCDPLAEEAVAAVPAVGFCKRSLWCWATWA